MSETPTYAEIAQMLNDRAAEFAPHILGESPTHKTGRELRFYPKGGLVVHLTGKRAGRFTAYGDNGGSGDMVDLIRFHCGKTRHEAIEMAKNWLGITDDNEGGRPVVSAEERAARKKAAEDEERANQEKRLRVANWLWGLSRDDHQAVIGYMNNRGIPIDTLPACVRARKLDRKSLEEMGLLKHGVSGEIWAAVFSATNLKGEVRAVQQVLIHNGQKITKSFPDARNPKRTNGLMEGAAVKISMPDDTLALAEGPETGFSFHVATGIPTWIVLGKENFTRVEIPDSVRRLLICVDIEEQGNGIEAALRTAAHWQSLGYEVELVLPDTETGDFNDVLQEKGCETIKASVEQSLKSPANRATEGTVLCRDPRDGLLIWQATGYSVLSTIKEINYDYHGPVEAPKKLVVLTADNEPIDHALLASRYPQTDIRGFTVRTRSLRDAVGDIAAMADLVRFATPAGKTALFGLSRLIGRHDNPVILCPGAKDATRAGKATSRAVIAWTDKPHLCDFTPLAGRDIVVAAVHSPQGQKEAADVVAEVMAAGAASASVLEWPLYAPEGASHVIRHRRLPKNYGLGQALSDGWNANEKFDSLLELAVAV